MLRGGAGTATWPRLDALGLCPKGYSCMSRRCGGYHRVAAFLEVLGQVPRRWSRANFQLDFRHRDLHLLVMLCSLLGTTAQPSGIIGAFVSRIWRIQQVPSSETALPLPACWPRRQVAPSACEAHEPGVVATAASNYSRVCTGITRRLSYLGRGSSEKQAVTSGFVACCRCRRPRRS